MRLAGIEEAPTTCVGIAGASFVPRPADRSEPTKLYPGIRILQVKADTRALGFRTPDLIPASDLANRGSPARRRIRGLSGAPYQGLPAGLKRCPRPNQQPKLQLESKVRSKGFSLIYKWLTGCDAVILKADRNNPLIVMELKELTSLLGQYRDQTPTPAHKPLAQPSTQQAGPNNQQRTLKTGISAASDH
jgi:hypothetical protein